VENSTGRLSFLRAGRQRGVRGQRGAREAGGENGWKTYYRGRHAGVDPPCSYWNCDANGSGRCNTPQAPEVDFDDINPFVAELVTPPACP